MKKLKKDNYVHVRYPSEKKSLLKKIAVKKDITFSKMVSELFDRIIKDELGL